MITKQLTFVIFSALLAFATGCATTNQARRVSTSGFLGDYSKLEKGAGDQALLRYVNPGAVFAKYDSVIVDPVAVYVEAKDGLIRDVTEEDLEHLSGYLRTAVRNELQQDYKIVETPGPTTLRIRMAITEAEGSKVVLDTLSNFLPPMIAMSTVKRLATGTHAFVGEASAECEFVDSVTGERLAAAVDRRAGEKVLRGKLGTWNDVYESYDYWAKRIREVLAQERAKAS